MALRYSIFPIVLPNNRLASGGLSSKLSNCFADCRETEIDQFNCEINMSNASEMFARYLSHVVSCSYVVSVSNYAQTKHECVRAITKIRPAVDANLFALV